MRKILILLFSVALMSIARGQETRFGGKLDLETSKDLTLEFEAEARADNHFTQFETLLLEAGLAYQINDLFEVKSGYRHSFIPDNFVATGSPDINEDRVTLSFYFEKEFVEDLDIQYRTRYQWAKEVEGGEGDHRQYIRNRLLFDYNLTSIADPYISGEFYYRIDRKYQINQWRIEFGLDIELTDDLDMEVFYRHQRDVNVRIPDTDRIVEINLQYNLNL